MNNENETQTHTALFAGGCFWCVEHDLREAPGVTAVVSGYTGGSMENPTYEDVLTETTGHREAVKVSYDPTQISFKKLVQFFLDHIDPTDTEGQFADKGESYRSAIFYATRDEQNIAQSLLMELSESGVYDKPIATELIPRTAFYTAEESHQNYAEKNPIHYAMYRKGSGREDFVQGVCKIREEKHIEWKE